MYYLCCILICCCSSSINSKKKSLSLSSKNPSYFTAHVRSYKKKHSTGKISYLHTCVHCWNCPKLANTLFMVACYKKPWDRIAMNFWSQIHNICATNKCVCNNLLHWIDVSTTCTLYYWNLLNFVNELNWIESKAAW